MMSYRVNAGPLPPTHWAHDPEVGGGRVLGEVCHFVDTLSFICGHPLVQVKASALDVPGPGHPPDNVVATLHFADGSIGNIVYASGVSTALPKERLEVFGGNCSAVVDDFRALELYAGTRKVKTFRTGGQQKGFREEMESFLGVIRGVMPPAFTLEELAAVSRATFRIQESIQQGRSLPV